VQGAQALAERVPGDELGQLRGDQVVLAAGQPGVRQPFQHGQALLGQAERLGPDELGVRHVRVRLAAPQPQRRRQPFGVVRLRQVGEPVGVHRGGAQQVAGRAGLDQVTGARLGVAERLA
jgi:hypothetical protein